MDLTELRGEHVISLYLIRDLFALAVDKVRP
jgi:hypothetical protein